MAVSDIAWRVNKSPRFTALELGEYMASEDGPRETILRNAKYERLGGSLLYRTVQQDVARFLASPTRDRTILVRCRERLVAARNAAVDPKKRARWDLQLAALTTFEERLNRLAIAGIEISLASPRQNKLNIADVAVSVFPTVWLTKRRMRWADLVGGLIVDFAKGDACKTDEAKAKAAKAMMHSAILLHSYVERERCHDGSKPSPEHCLIFHVHRGDVAEAPSGYKRDLHNIHEACRGIADRWEKIRAPSSFDPAKAAYRD
jgi:hypothetical protein